MKRQLSASSGHLEAGPTNDLHRIVGGAHDVRPQMTSPARERNSLLRLFGSPNELIDKANADLARLADALARYRQRDALWALADCSITVFHIGDWIRATRSDHDIATGQLLASSKWIRMTRDICHAAKHGDLTWRPEQAEIHGPTLAKLEYRISRRSPEAPHRIVAILPNRAERDVLVILRNAIDDWARFVAERQI